MSNPVAFSTNSDPFRGGSFTPATAPGGVNGAIAGAANGSSLIGSVTGGTPMLARNNRGTNITVPYARVVFHPPGNTALPPPKGEFDDKTRELDLASRMLKTPYSAIMTETEMLYSGRLAFVLGRRGEVYNTGVESAMGLDLLSAFGGPTTTRPTQISLAPGTGGVATAQRLCSFEYLERYFSHVLSSRSIVVGDGALANLSALAPGLKGAAANKRKGGGAAPDYNFGTALNPAAIDVTAILKATSEAPDASFSGIAKQGIDADNTSPFLHGGSMNRKVHVGTAHKMTNVTIGDEIAFKWLYSAMLKQGILDWTPDGIVMSKLSEGDRLLDDELDSRDGMLFNVAVAGPAISSLWSQDADLEVMPLDRVFILIIADRWVGDQKATVDGMTREAYADLKKAELNKKADAADAGTTYTLTNFRIKRATSAQMVAACMAPDSGLSKLGLSRSGNVAEYVVGGWCIGSVIDSAASRAASGDASTLLGAVKRTRVNSAHNVVVKCEWWDADRLCRSYGPRGRRARYDGARPRRPISGPYPVEIAGGQAPGIPEVGLEPVSASMQRGLRGKRI